MRAPAAAPGGAEPFGHTNHDIPINHGIPANHGILVVHPHADEHHPHADEHLPRANRDGHAGHSRSAPIHAH